MREGEIGNLVGDTTDSFKLEFFCFFIDWGLDSVPTP
jgi:hypothetical protein